MNKNKKNPIAASTAVICFMMAVLALKYVLMYMNMGEDYSTPLILLVLMIIMGILFLTCGDKLTADSGKAALLASERHKREMDAPKKLLETEVQNFFAVQAVGRGKKEYERLISFADAVCPDRDEFNRDYYEGEIFRSNASVINIGRMYTVYCGTDNQFVVKNSDITGISTDESMTFKGMYPSADYFVILSTADNRQYCLHCDVYMNGHIAKALKDRTSSVCGG